MAGRAALVPGPADPEVLAAELPALERRDREPAAVDVALDAGRADACAGVIVVAAMYPASWQAPQVTSAETSSGRAAGAPLASSGVNVG